MSNTILDSSLITQTFLKKYNFKLIECGDYIQLYIYSNDKIKKNNDELAKTIKSLKRNKICPINNSSLNCSTHENNLKTIDIKNINRSKISCQLLAKCNMSSWKSFITLTYADNIKDISLSRKHLNIFLTKVRRVYNDFKYICVTEFQKRGAIHFHLLTNISLDNSSLIYFQDFDTSSDTSFRFPHIKYWSYGFNSVEVIEKDSKKVIGYISKYMTKDIDNRLWGKRRYTYSQNLQHPFINYLSFGNKIDISHYIEKLTTKYDLTYNNTYKEKYTNNDIYFFELLKN